MPQTNENAYASTNLFFYVHINIINQSQNVKATQISIKCWVYKKWLSQLGLLLLRWNTKETWEWKGLFSSHFHSTVHYRRKSRQALGGKKLLLSSEIPQAKSPLSALPSTFLFSELLQNSIGFSNPKFQSPCTILPPPKKMVRSVTAIPHYPGAILFLLGFVLLW